MSPLLLASWLAACGGAPQPVEPPAFDTVRIEHPAHHWMGWVEIDPPVRIPGVARGAGEVQVWLRLPPEGEVTVAQTEAGPRLRWPPGTVADRVELRGTTHPKRVVDVRGTELRADGAAWDHLYRPSGPGPGAPLIGVAWPQADAAAREAAVAWLAQTVGALPPVSTWTPVSQAKWADSLRRKSACDACHQPALPDAATRGAHGPVARGTDAVGWFTPQAVFADGGPAELYGEDRNVGPFADVSCGDEAPDRVHDHWRCSADRPATVTVDLAAALAADDAHARAVCAARQAIAARFDEAARAWAAPALAACDR